MTIEEIYAELSEISLQLSDRFISWSRVSRLTKREQELRKLLKEIMDGSHSRSSAGDC